MSDLKEIPTYHAVIYTDGSALPNPGFYGAGIHGYIYNVNNIGVNHNDTPTNITLTETGYIHKDVLTETDKSIKPEYYLDAGISYMGVGTNNMAELLASIAAVDYMLDSELHITKIVVITDSAYVNNIFNLVMKNDVWKSIREVPNYDLRVQAYETLTRCAKDGLEVVIQDVKGHSGDFGNNMSDRLAFVGRQNSTNKIVKNDMILTTATRYWKPNKNKNPLIDYKQLFFTIASREITSSYMYVVMEYKTDVELGKKNNAATFGLVVLNEKVDIIEDVISLYQKNMRTLSVLSSVDLSLVYGQKHMFYYEHFKEGCYVFNKKRYKLNLLEEIDIVKAIQPPGLANQAMSRTLELNQILNSYKTGVTNNRLLLDITDSIYGVNDKDKKICKLSNGTKLLEIELLLKDKKISFPMVLGVDTLDRNQFNRMVKDNVKVTLVIDQPDEHYLEYYSVVENITKGDIGVYTNFYSNKYYLKVKKNKKY